MDKILMRHDDVNTFGVFLYVNLRDGTHVFKDRECTQPITYDEFKEVVFKVPYVGAFKDGAFTNSYAKIYHIWFQDESMIWIDIQLPDGSTKSFGVQNENAQQMPK